MLSVHREADLRRGKLPGLATTIGMPVGPAARTPDSNEKRARACWPEGASILAVLAQNQIIVMLPF